jgi:hypothetical protein
MRMILKWIFLHKVVQMGGGERKWFRTHSKVHSLEASCYN